MQTALHHTAVASSTNGVPARKGVNALTLGAVEGFEAHGALATGLMCFILATRAALAIPATLLVLTLDRSFLASYAFHACSAL